MVATIALPTAEVIERLVGGRFALLVLVERQASVLLARQAVVPAAAKVEQPAVLLKLMFVLLVEHFPDSTAGCLLLCGLGLLVAEAPAP